MNTERCCHIFCGCYIPVTFSLLPFSSVEDFFVHSHLLLLDNSEWFWSVLLFRIRISDPNQLNLEEEVCYSVSVFVVVVFVFVIFLCVSVCICNVRVRFNGCEMGTAFSEYLLFIRIHCHIYIYIYISYAIATEKVALLYTTRLFASTSQGR